MTEQNPAIVEQFSVVHKQIPALAGVNRYQHPQQQLLYSHKGVLAVITSQGRFIVPPKHSIVVPAQLPHELLAKTEVNLSAVYFPSIEPQVANIAVKSHSAFFRALMEECHSVKHQASWQEKDILLLKLIYLTAIDASDIDSFLPYPKDSRLLDITEKLLKHPSLKTDLVSWGKFVKASARTLTRNFKKETGITYSQWRQRLNVQIAIKHLAQGEAIADIAKLLGYESASAFIFMFRQQMAISPKQFVKSTQ